MDKTNFDDKFRVASSIIVAAPIFAWIGLANFLIEIISWILIRW